MALTPAQQTAFHERGVVVDGLLEPSDFAPVEHEVDASIDRRVRPAKEPPPLAHRLVR